MPSQDFEFSCLLAVMTVMTVTCTLSLLVVILCLVSRAAEPPRVRENQQLGVAVEVQPVSLRPNLTRCEENYCVSRNRDRQHPIEHDERGQV